MNKCEWKELTVERLNKLGTWRDYEFRSLKEEDGELILGVVKKDKNVGRTMEGYLKKGCRYFYKRLTPPEPIIVKSGETWVASFEGVDYLCRNNTQSQPPFFYYEGDIRTIPSTWKPFSEIEITDTIAKLRPIVVNGQGYIYKLYGVDIHGMLILQDNRKGELTYKHPDTVRLATVKDLEE